MLKIILAVIRFFVRLLDRLAEKQLDAADNARAAAKALNDKAGDLSAQARSALRLSGKLEDLL